VIYVDPHDRAHYGLKTEEQVSEKMWKVEWKKYTSVNMKTFKDGGAAKRWFQKYGEAKLTEYERNRDGSTRILSVAVAGDFFQL
jgi:hypothetical protein